MEAKQREMIEAIKTNNISDLKKLIKKKNVSPNFYLNGITPICAAAKDGNVSALEILIEGKCILCTPNVQDDVWQRMPIHIAASKGHCAFLRKLLEQPEVDVNLPDNDGRTALHWAAIFGNVEIIDILLEAGAKVNGAQNDGFTPLYAATCFGHYDICCLLIKNGGNTMMTDSDGWNILHTASNYGHLNIVKHLGTAKSCLNSATKDGETALHIATSSGHLAVVEYLVHCGIPLNKQNSRGYTALHLSVYYNRPKCCQFLLDNGADMYIQNKDKQSLCYLVALRMDPVFLSILLHAGYNFSLEQWIHLDSFPATSIKKYEEQYELMKHLASNPPSLLNISGLRIRRLLGSDYKSNCKSLPIPKYLKNYIICPDPNLADDS